MELSQQLIRTPYPDTQILNDSISELDNAIVVPPKWNNKREKRPKLGVFTKEKNFEQNSINFTPKGQLNCQPDFPEMPYSQLDGNWMYMGPLLHHFGHFLTESIARIWAWDKLHSDLDGLLFVPKQNNEKQSELLNRYSKVIESLGVNTRYKLISKPTTVTKLFVPRVGLGVGSWMSGSRAFRDFARKRSSIRTTSAKKIYISRFALSNRFSSYLGEGYFQKFIKQCGYEVIHPQQLTIEEQVKILQQASHIISPEGTPLHLLSLVGNKNQRVSIIPRRKAWGGRDFVGQLNTLAGAKAQKHDCLLAEWLPDTLKKLANYQWGEIDFRSLVSELHDSSMIDDNKLPFYLDTFDIDEELEAIKAMTGTELKRRAV
ncbi:MAG: glycosyltransferase 61 family protein [Pseudomonadota bacterium]